VIKKIRVSDAKRQALLIRSSSKIPQNSILVQKIINDVIKFGDKAIIKYTKKFDNVKIDSILVEKADFRNAYQQVTMNQLNALKKSKKLLEKNEKMILDRLTGIIVS
jgi:histidinol dehydrogenase